MARSQGLQAFLEQRAEGPAFAIVFVCMIARAAQFYSGGALSLARVLGAMGMQVFNIATGVGLSVGCELLFAIAGRTWQANKHEARDVMARKGMSRAERLALRDYYLSKARISAIFMLIGLAASLSAAFSFLWSANGDHSVSAALGEALISLLLVTVVGYLAIFKESRGQDPGEIATEHAYAARTTAIAEAGKRIASGEYSARDVRVVARQLPKAERDRFEIALMPDSADDPHWTARDLLTWLGDESGATKRRVQRKLAKLYDNGAGVIRDDTTGQYRIPRSLVLKSFSDEFLEAHAPGRVQRAVKGYAGPATDPRQTGGATPHDSSGDSDNDATATMARHPSDTPATPTQTVNATA